MNCQPVYGRTTGIRFDLRLNNTQQPLLNFNYYSSKNPPEHWMISGAIHQKVEDISVFIVPPRISRLWIHTPRLCRPDRDECRPRDHWSYTDENEIQLQYFHIMNFNIMHWLIFLKIISNFYIQASNQVGWPNPETRFNLPTHQKKALTDCRMNKLSILLQESARFSLKIHKKFECLCTWIH